VFTLDQASASGSHTHPESDISDLDTYIPHSLANAANDFLVASADDTFVKKTLAETGAILEGDIDHGNIQGLSDDDHTQYIKDSEFTKDSSVLVGTGAGTFAAEDGATLRTSLGLTFGTDVLAEQTIGIADNNLVEIDSASVADNDFAKFTASGLEGQTTTEIVAQLRTDGLIGIDDNDILEVDGTVADNDILRATAAGVEGRTYAELVDTDLKEELQDLVGAMVTGNTETNITVTYQDADGTIDFVAEAGGSGGNCYIETGTYTGDGSTDQEISLSDSDLVVKYVKIWPVGAHGTRRATHHTTDTIIDDDADGAAWIAYTDGNAGHAAAVNDDAIIELATGSFSVDDNGANSDPNKSGTVYNYMVFGTH